jgi:predicted SAM-dependent methyltransferase
VRRLVKKALALAGYELRRLPRAQTQAPRPDTSARVAGALASGLDKAHYGSAGRMFAGGWLNMDLRQALPGETTYLQLDLTGAHPFPNGFFRFGFAEDFLEHLDQEQSLRFLVEACRTLKKGGVLRLSFPGLEGVLKKHYAPPTWPSAHIASAEAYSMWGHKHFYSLEELRTAASHVGFSRTDAVRFGVSRYAELCDLDHREDQQELNTYVELVK